MHFGFWQLMIVLILVVLLFGTNRLRNLGGDLGSAIKGFKKAMSDEEKAASEEQAKVEKKPDQSIIDVTPEKKKDQV
ncbi:MAG TPA: twin-arginine translocase TatA/TatE family subunit [Dongiaceae bacterium]|nr:twin-arginine translocase TatA/TatE family subunit [Dongiaceae bacterium]